LGCCGPGFRSNRDEALRAFKYALSHGINLVDIAPSYGEAEDGLEQLISENRDKLIIAEKTMERTREGAWRELKQSLKKLNVEYFDIYQFHAVTSMEALDQIFSDNGAMRAFLEARDQGLIKHIDITGHGDLRVIMKALEKFDFDTVLISVNAVNAIYSNPSNDYRPLLRMCIDRNIGVIAIKAIAKRRWRTREKRYIMWYEPFDQQEEIEKAVWFTLSQEGVTTYSIACDIRLWPMIISAGESFRKLSEEEKEVMNYFKQKDIEPVIPAPERPQI